MSIHDKNKYDNDENDFPEEQDVPSDEGNIHAETEKIAAHSREIIRISELKGQVRYKNELSESLQEVVDSGRFRPSSNDGLYKDKAELERICGINFDKELLYSKDVFIAFWEGHYQHSEARFQLMVRLIEEEKKTERHYMMTEHRSDWVSWYFRGCDVNEQEVQMPAEQNPDEVIAILNEDCAIVERLPMEEKIKQETIRKLRIDFLEGKYPILLDRKDPASRDAAIREIMQIASRPPSEEGMDLRSAGISIAMQRYRMDVAQELDHETEMIKRRAESKSVNALYQQDFERRQADFETEVAFLETLDLPDFESNEWPRTLERCANSPFFKINRQLREEVHQFVDTLVERAVTMEMPRRDPWGAIINLLQAYWAGHYYPDPIRTLVYKNELAQSDCDYVSLTTHFVHGCGTENAKLNASQDPILLCRAYQRDMKLVHDLGFDESTTRDIEWEYNEYLLKGHLPLAVDYEMPEDRIRLEREMHEYAEQAKKGKYVFSTGFLQMFCDYWHPISKRSAK